MLQGSAVVRPSIKGARRWLLIIDRACCDPIMVVKFVVAVVIREFLTTDQPCHRLAQQGASALSDAQLLAVITRSAMTPMRTSPAFARTFPAVVAASPGTYTLAVTYAMAKPPKMPTMR